MASVTSLSHSVEQHLASALSAALPEAVGADPLLRRSDRADYQANGILALAKKAKANPRELATQVVAQVVTGDLIKDIEVSGPGFLNVTITDKAIVENLGARYADADRLGVPLADAPGRTVIDYAQPNVAKEMHVGHLRSAVIGAAVTEILEFTGESVVRRHHIGDWGTQFGMLIQYLDEHPHELDHKDAQVSGEEAMSNLDRLYKAARRLFDADEEFKTRARRRVVDLQAGDPHTLAVWQKFVDESKIYFFSVFDKLDMEIRDEDIVGESGYNDMLAETCRLLEEKGVAVRSEGALCVFFDDVKGPDGNPVPLIVQKSDGGYGYAATDLSAIRDRVFQLKANSLVYVVDARQSLHFKMVFETARRAGWLNGGATAHQLAFGTVLGKDGKPFKTREGETVKLVDLLDEAVDRATAVVREKAEKVGLSEPEIEENGRRRRCRRREVRGPVDLGRAGLQVRPGPDGVVERRHVGVPAVRVRPYPVDPAQGGRGASGGAPGAGTGPGGAGVGSAPGPVRRDGPRGRGGLRAAQAGGVPVPAGLAPDDVLRPVPRVVRGQRAGGRREPPLPGGPDGPHPPQGHGPAGHPDAGAALTRIR